MSRILFVAGDGDGTEERAALAWLHSANVGDIADTCARRVRADEIDLADVVWLHAGARVARIAEVTIDALRRRVEEGAGLLLTLLATPIVVDLGLEDHPPEERGLVPWSDEADPLWPEAFRDWPDFPHVRGLQAWGPHPLFERLGRGTFTWRATARELAGEATYIWPRWPHGRVIAVDRAYVQLDATKAVAWEYAVGGGRIVCIGAHLCFAAADRTLAAQRDVVIRNALATLGRRRPEARHWWPSPRATLPPLDSEMFRPLPLGAGLSGSTSPLTLTSLALHDDPYTLAGRRALVLGGERSGLREVWVHPLCVLSGGTDLRIDGEPADVASVEVAPAGLVRHLRAGTRFIEERTFVPLDDPVAIVEFSHRPVAPMAPGVEPPRVELTASLPLRLEWPMPVDALRPVRTVHRTWSGGASLYIVGCDDRYIALVQVEGAATISMAGDVAGPRIGIRGSLATPLRVICAASSRGRDALHAALDSIARRGVRALAMERTARIASLARERVGLSSPDASLDMAIEWAKVRMHAFVASVPGVGSGLMAGFAATGAGWSASRPGYAWFFGRDACWCVFALLACGMFDEARAAIALLAETQDVTGKIVHELTTSGVAHYDAADSTPLFVCAVSAYARWTGDLETVRGWWPSVVRGIDYVLACDDDGDGLPENSGIGHGWIESGPLGGGAVTSYVASIWLSALEGLVDTATLVGDHSLASRASAAATRVREAIRERLFDANQGRHALQRMADGTLVTDVTALSAVPILFGAVSGSEAASTLDLLAAPEFSAPWGVRMLSRRDSRYSPTGYHSGAVWPLFTGWVALAEYRQHRGEAGHRHLMANALLCYDRAKGAFDEVLHGDELRAAGVCPDQAWSAAMVLLPLVEGMLGALPSACERRLRLSPHWPRAWSRAHVSSLRVGEATVEIDATVGCEVDDIEYEGMTYRVRCVPPGAITLTLEHPVAGAPGTRARIDGREVTVERCGSDACPHLRVIVRLERTTTIQFIAATAEPGGGG